MLATPGDSEEDSKHTVILKAQGAENESGMVIYKTNLHRNIIINSRVALFSSAPKY